MSLFALLNALPVRALIPYIWEFVPLEEKARAATDDWKQSLLNRDARYWPAIFEHADVWWWEFKKLLVQNQGRFVVEDTHQQFCFAAVYTFNFQVSSVNRHSTHTIYGEHRMVGWEQQFVRVHIVLRGGRVLFHNLAVLLHKRAGSAWFSLKPSICGDPTLPAPVHRLTP